MDDVRLDTWLDIACLFKTRSQAARAVKLGRVTVDGRRVKPHMTVRVDTTIRIETLSGSRVVKVREVVDRHVRRERARELYEDITPEPTERERERAARDASMRLRFDGRGKPSRRDRARVRRFLKEGRE